jgi:predicted dehydrogenase
MQKFTASVTGGGMGGKLSLNALARSERFELVAAADLRADVREGLKAQFSGLKIFATHQEMFAACPTEITCVSTFPPSHESITKDALAMLPELKGILVEKPLGHTAASGRQIVELVQARKLPLAVPHGLIAKRTPLELIERVQSGEIGELLLVEIQFRGWDIINAGIHWLNFCVRLIDSPVVSVLTGIDATTRTFRDGMQVETEAITYIIFQNGVRVAMHNGDFAPIHAAGNHDFLFRLYGTKGQAEFYAWPNEYILNGIKNTPEEFATTGHQRHLEALPDQIDSGVLDYGVAESSLIALELCEAAYLSNKHRCTVRFPLANFSPPESASGWEPGVPYLGVGGRDGRT